MRSSARVDTRGGNQAATADIDSTVAGLGQPPSLTTGEAGRQMGQWQLQRAFWAARAQVTGFS
jgi:hypothetical protein